MVHAAWPLTSCPLVAPTVVADTFWREPSPDELISRCANRGRVGRPAVSVSSDQSAKQGDNRQSAADELHLESEMRFNRAIGQALRQKRVSERANDGDQQDSDRKRSPRLTEEDEGGRCDGKGRALTKNGRLPIVGPSPALVQ